MCATHCMDWPGCSRCTSGGVCSVSGIAWLQPVHKWGMEIQRYEIREVTAPHSIREAMDMQVRARAPLRAQSMPAAAVGRSVRCGAACASVR